MLLVGLTGGIGAGKSTVSVLLAERGAVIVDADQIARDLQLPGSPVLDRMAERFGDDIINDDGSLDRAAVAAVVFGESDEAKQALVDLNGIVHPAMQDEIKRQIVAHADTETIVVLDFPLLGENPRDDIAATVVVDVPHEVAIRRLVEMRGMDEDDARNRIVSQIDREERLATATHVVDNSGDLDRLRSEVDALWDELVGLQTSGPG
jgi:dephospho-CoA kinase